MPRMRREQDLAAAAGLVAIADERGGRRLGEQVDLGLREPWAGRARGCRPMTSAERPGANAGWQGALAKLSTRVTMDSSWSSFSPMTRKSVRRGSLRGRSRGRGRRGGGFSTVSGLRISCAISAASRPRVVSCSCLKRVFLALEHAGVEPGVSGGRRHRGWRAWRTTRFSSLSKRCGRSVNTAMASRTSLSKTSGVMSAAWSVASPGQAGEAVEIGGPTSANSTWRWWDRGGGKSRRRRVVRRPAGMARRRHRGAPEPDGAAFWRRGDTKAQALPVEHAGGGVV